MAPVSIPTFTPAEPTFRTSGNAGPGTVWTVFNANEEDSGGGSIDWALWKDKALKWLSGAWTFAGKHGMFLSFANCMASILIISVGSRSWRLAKGS